MKLAIHGGTPIRTRPFPAQNAFGKEEEEAVVRVLRSGCASGYMGNATDSFYGGPEIRALEAAVQERFNVKHAICVNSATSGLFVALGAVLGPIESERVGNHHWDFERDMLVRENIPEVIVSPYSMTCSASLPLAWGARPVFADIDPQTYGHDEMDLKGRIGPNTRAVLTVSLFGHPIDRAGINYRIAEEITGSNAAVLIEDAAQAIGAYEEVLDLGFPTDEPRVMTMKGRRIYAGTAGDIGVYSLNLGKHISAGEGGIIVTDSDGHAIMCRLLMNHAEAVIHDWRRTGSRPPGTAHVPDSLYGFNCRMTETTAAVARVQFSRLDWILERQRANAARLIEGICTSAPCLDPPYVREGCVHSWYVIPFRWNAEEADGIDRQRFIDAVRAELAPAEGRLGEGFPLRAGYVDPICSMPIFNLPPGTCPECERAQEEIVILYRVQNPQMEEGDIADVIAAFAKCWAEKEALR